LQVAGEIIEMGRHVCLETGEEMVETEEHEPILMFLTLCVAPAGVVPSEISELMTGLQTHPQR
jgi:hypothetical protein